MKYGWALHCLLRYLFADAAQGLVYILKANISDGFYSINLRPANAPKLRLIFPVDNSDKPLVAVPLNLPMGWKNSTSLFCTETETITDLANQDLLAISPCGRIIWNIKQLQFLALKPQR